MFFDGSKFVRLREWQVELLACPDNLQSGGASSGGVGSFEPAPAPRSGPQSARVATMRQAFMVRNTSYNLPYKYWPFDSGQVQVYFH